MIDIVMSFPRRHSYLDGLATSLLNLDKLDLAEFRCSKSLIIDLGLRKELKRHRRCAVFKINDKLIFLDGNNELPPTTRLIGNDVISRFDLVIKLQCRNIHLYDCPVPLTNWTFPLLKYGDIRPMRKMYKRTKNIYDCGFVGRTYSFRQPMLSALKEIPNCDVEYWALKKNKDRRSSPLDYMKRMTSWHSAYIPRGNRTDSLDGKTWREIECAGMSVPILLDCIGGPPNYYVPFEPYKHYIPVTCEEDLEPAIQKAKKDSRKLRIRAFEWYKKAVSPRGICTTFMQLLREHDIIS